MLVAEFLAGGSLADVLISPPILRSAWEPAGRPAAIEYSAPEQYGRVHLLS